MEAEEVLRLKQVTGLKRAFMDHKFSESWYEFVSKNYKVDSFSTIDKFSDDSQKLFRQAYDLNAYHTSILKDPNASESEKQKSLNALNNIQRVDY